MRDPHSPLIVHLIYKVFPEFDVIERSAILENTGDDPIILERLPPEPLVIEPVEEIGQIGGTWHMINNDDTNGWTRQTVLVEPFLKWNRDANGFRRI